MLRTAFPSMTRFPGTTHAPWCRSETCWKDGRGPTAGLMPGSTNRVHVWVGGSMLPMSSPNDPIFMLHHCNVDRIWAKWQLPAHVRGPVSGPRGRGDGT